MPSAASQRQHHCLAVLALAICDGLSDGRAVELRRSDRRVGALSVVEAECGIVRPADVVHEGHIDDGVGGIGTDGAER